MVHYLVMFTLLRHQYPAVGNILIHSVNLAFGPKSASKINVGLGLGSGFKMRPVYNSVMEVMRKQLRHKSYT